MHPVGAAVGGTGAYGNKDDYIAHHEPFQYYASTANPHHLAPTSLAAIGTDTQTTSGGAPQFNTANHQYDMSDFDAGRCGYGPRLPLLVISPSARHNYVDHTLTSQTSILRFVEDNWSLPRISGSFDAVTGSLNHLFDFHGRRGQNPKLFLDPVTGQPFGGF